MFTTPDEWQGTREEYLWCIEKYICWIHELRDGTDVTSGSDEIYQWTAWALPGMFTQDNISAISTERCRQYRKKYTTMSYHSESSESTENAEDEDWNGWTSWYNNEIPGWGDQPQHWSSEDQNEDNNEAMHHALDRMVQRAENMHEPYDELQLSHHRRSSSERELWETSIPLRFDRVPQVWQTQPSRDQTIEPEAEDEPTPSGPECTSEGGGVYERDIRGEWIRKWTSAGVWELVRDATDHRPEGDPQRPEPESETANERGAPTIPRNPNTQSSVSQAAGSFVDHALDFFHTHMNGINALGDEETPDEGASIPWSHKRAKYEKALASIVYVNSPEIRERVSNRLNQPRLVSWSDSDGKDRDDAASTVYRAESTVYRQQRPPKQVYNVRKGPRYNNWYPARGHYGVHRWVYRATKTRIGICVMGDVYGPYGRDHRNVLNWAWQTWPQSIRRMSSAGHCLPIVDMIKQHVQCEIDLHHAACELLGLLRVPTPLVYRPWLEDTSDPPWHISSSTAGQGWIGSTEKPLAAGRIHDGPRTRRDLVQAVD